MELMFMPGRTSILIADDEYPTRHGVMSALLEWSHDQFDVFTAENGIEALECIRIRRPDVVITDIRMPGLNGIELLERMKAEGLDTASILLTGYAEFEYAQKAVKLRAANYILKPVERDELIAAVEEALAASGRQRLAKKAEAAEIPARSSVPEHMPVARNPWIQKALAYIGSEYPRPTLSVKEVARHIHLSPSYVSVLFKEEVQQTFSDFLTGLRLKRAKELLLESDLKVYEIAERTGFSSAKYFVKVFRETEQMTPKQFRRCHTDRAFASKR
jgi:two-component system response regulator YesN